MDRVFLDANVLFSAAYQIHSQFRALWKFKDAVLCTSPYAIEEARRNLLDENQRHDLKTLIQTVHVVNAVPAQFPNSDSIALPPKDLPILLGAIAAQATHLLTGDATHFGPFFGKTVEGIHILPPGQYLQSKHPKGR